MKPKVITVVCLPVIGLIICLGFTNEEKEALINRVFNNEICYRVSGNFVDSNNIALTGITAEIGEDQNMAAGVGTRREQVFDSSDFTITSVPCQSMSVTFYKDGYYPVNITTKGILDYLDGNVSMVDGNIIVSPPCTVAFESIGPITPNVAEISVPLTIKINGPDIELEYINFPFVGRSRSEYWQKDYVSSESQLPASTIYVWPTFSADGTIETARMVTSIPESGFILKSDIEDDIGFIRRMKEAPETGYSASVAIPATNIANGEDCYFYVKIGDMYGKGNLYVSDNFAHLNLYLNNDVGTADSRRINPKTF